MIGSAAALVTALPWALTAMLGIQEIGAARTDVLAATGPIFAVLLAGVVLRERLGRRVLAGTFLSVAGIMLVVAQLGGG